VGNIREEFYNDIATNDAQWTEWKDLFHIDEEEQDLFTVAMKTREEKRIAFLKAHPTLVLDTKYFDEDFVDRLLASFENLDEQTDGLLIHGENFQALSLLVEKYREKVKCIYIDPPYNTAASEIIYKNDYKHSSWLSLIENRIVLGKLLLKKHGVQVVAIDEVEQEVLGLLLKRYFPDYQKTCITIVSNPSGQQGNNFSYCHDYAYFVYPSGSGRFIGLRVRTENPDIRPLRDVSKGSHLREDAANCFYPIFIKDEEIIGFGDVCDDSFHPSSANIHRADGVIEVYPIDAQGNERKWVWARDTVETIRDELRVVYNRNRGIWDIIRTKTEFNYTTVWSDKRYSANSYGSRLLNNIIDSQKFSFPKSIYTVKDCIQAASGDDCDALVLDYFAGSGTTGHAVINLNREDGGRRKFILVEMDNYFDTVLLPRIKKVTFTPEWRDGKPVRMSTPEEAARSPRIIKYIRLESYDDALNNISFTTPAGQQVIEFDDYLLKYMLDWETRESETFLNVQKLASPFCYELILTEGRETKKKRVDIPETFNFLLGLHISSRQVYQDGNRRYVVYRGTIEDKRVVVIWRVTEGWGKEDYERDKKFVAEQKLTEGTDEVFVNGDSFIPGARSLDPVFKSRMFGGV
jgi:adenine-specific DNA-methyltransferase